MTGAEFSTIAAAIHASSLDIAAAAGFTDRHVRRMPAMDVVPERAAEALLAMESAFIAATRAGDPSVLHSADARSASAWTHRNFVKGR